MTTSEDYEAVYAELVPAYQLALADGNSAEVDRLGAAIFEAARGLISVAFKDTRNSYWVPAGLLEDAIADAGVIVLQMARDWDPSHGVAFVQWFKSRKAPWREAASPVVDLERNGADLRVAEKRVLSVARGVVREFFNEHGREPTALELSELMGAASRARGDDQEATEARNVRSGYAAAERDAYRLLQATKSQVHPDTAGAEGVSMWDALASTDTDPTGEAATSLDMTQVLAELAGLDLTELADERKVPAAARHTAMSRLGSPHAQWAFMAAQVHAGT